MRRSIAVLPLALLLTACAGSGKADLADCAASWNTGVDHTALAGMAQGGTLSVRLSRFDSGECALTYNAGVIGAFVVRDGRWENYAGGMPSSAGDVSRAVAEPNRLVGYIYEAAQEEPNVMTGVYGTVQPIDGERIGRFDTSL